MIGATDDRMTSGTDRPTPDDTEALLSDEPTMELVRRARAGDRGAVEALLQRSLPGLRRWAHGRLPASVRGSLDTGDLVQDAALHALGRLHAFEPRHVGAMQAYLRTSVMNRIRDEVRKVARHPAAIELSEDEAADVSSPLELAIEAESYDRYREAMRQLKPRDRELVLARVEAGWSLPEIAQQFGLTPDAARMAMMRALHRLREHMAAG